jgi:FAD/FMN-containing dehydrogenase
MSDAARLRTALGGIRVEDNPAIVKQKSRDFFWYSPILKRQLDHVTADLVVSPQNEAEVIETLRVCFAAGVPVTPRGAGTGNYGQAMPLAGGVVLSLADMNRVRSIGPGRVVADAGAVLADIDRATRADSGQEIRMYPSTYHTATVGGFIAGGSGGVGSINWGGLRDIGNVLRLRVVTMEESPRVMELAGRDLLKVMHAYGTNGIVTQVELPLEAACAWCDVIVAFDVYMDAVRFANLLGNRDGLLFKEIATVAAPLPYDYFLRHRKFLKREQSLVLLIVAPQAMEPLLALAAHEGGVIRVRAHTAGDADTK